MSDEGNYGHIADNPYRDFKGNPIAHPPIPGDNAEFSSTRPPDVIITGTAPGPGPVPIDPRVSVPRTLAVKRPSGQGCSSCRYNGTCRVLYWQRNFGGGVGHEVANGDFTLAPDIGTACESWNMDFPPPPPETWDQDGLGFGDPVANGTFPPEALDPTRYDGQYGDLRLPESVNQDSQNS